ncbi:hypothetical protein M5K25_007551 [Dendrobium thyrsiflorum]|uniref:CDT1 Geminin-binding domain-containing protein n=1 Tax=Dendrobium thyrsiflorum TaxID=117978 RepID=A0ABD0VEB2_DENTH
MEHEKSKEKQTPIEFRCRKIIPGAEKSTNVSLAAIKNVEDVVDEGSGNRIASPTPEKSDRKLSSRGKQLNDNSPSQDILSETHIPEITLKSTELPEKLKTLADLFDRMCSSVRLLGLRKRLPTFRDICTQVEILTKRKFSYAHLAQMKYVFPDAIQIEKVLVHDERTLCMKPDLKVSILFDIVGCPSYPGQTISMALCHAFRVRLLEQFNANQDAEIPEAVLPEPFNQRNDIEYLDSLQVKPFSEFPQQASVELDSFSVASHFSSSFRKHFCQKETVPEAERTKVLAPASLSAIVDDHVGKSSKNFSITSRKDSITLLSAIKSPYEAIYIPSPDNLVERTPEKGASTACDIVSELIDTPSTCIVPQSSQNTPANVSKIAGDAISETPALQTPKRPMPTPIEILVSTDEKSVNKPKSTPSVRRTLMYSPQKMDLSKSKLDFDTSEPIQVHEHYSNESLSIKRSICEQETKLTCDATARINEAQKLIQPNSEKRQAILDCLPAMFDTIHYISQSADCSLITKRELVHKIISNNLDIEETSNTYCEVEEQLGLLEELVPDWMYKKSTCNGEFLYCIKRLPDPDSVRTRLSEAV